MLTTNQIFCCDCLAGMAQMHDACIPLTVTSPPYGTMREYGGHGWDFPAVAEELYRITMTGGVLVWVVQEQIVAGSESGESSRQRLHFMDLGLRCHQTLIMMRPGSRQFTAKRYGCSPEYAFVFSKGVPRTFRPVACRRRKDMRTRPVTHRDADGHRYLGTDRQATKRVRRNACWTYAVGTHTAQESYAFAHPALMPEKMAADFIRSYSNVGDLVFDPMAGAATTLKMALLNSREFLGFEVNEQYVQIAKRRLEDAKEYQRQMRATLGGRVRAT